VRATYGWAGEVPDIVQTAVHALRLDASAYPRAQAACADVMPALGLVWQWISETDGWVDGCLRFAHGIVPDDFVERGRPCLPASKRYWTC
jgi:hypothetical protein